MDPMTAYVAQAWSLEGQLPLLIGIAALLGLGKGGVPGFATVATAATVATSPTNIPGGLGLAVALQVPILTMIDVSASWIHAKDLDFETIKILLPLSFVGMGLGQWLDKHLSDSSARLLVGIFLLLILAFQLTKDSIMNNIAKSGDGDSSDLPPSSSEHHKNDDDGDVLVMAESGSAHSIPSGLSHRRVGATHSHDNHTDNHRTHLSTKLDNHDGSVDKRPKVVLSQGTKLAWACIVGIVGGAATMLTNAMGPILNVYLLSVVKLSPTAYIGTRAMFFCFLNCGKVPMRFWAGTLGWKMMPLAAFLSIVSVIGVVGAKPIMMRMPESVFVKLELAVVAFSGLRLCWMGMYGL